jgi:hypothetical protein
MDNMLLERRIVAHGWGRMAYWATMSQADWR